MVDKRLEMFLKEEIGDFNFKISRETLIEDHLGVTGDEAIELIKKFSLKFDVDISAFTPSKYFYPEPNLFVSYGKVLPLTVGDLEIALSLGRLSDSYIGSSL